MYGLADIFHSATPADREWVPPNLPARLTALIQSSNTGFGETFSSAGLLLRKMPVNPISDQPPPFVRVRQNPGTGGSQTNLRRVPEFVESRALAEHAVLSCPTPTRGLIHRPTDGGGLRW